MRNSQRTCLARVVWVIVAVLCTAAAGDAQVFTGRIDVASGDTKKVLWEMSLS